MSNEKESEQPCKSDERRPTECIDCRIIYCCPFPRTKEGRQWKRDFQGWRGDE